MAFKYPSGFSAQTALDLLGFCQQAYYQYYIYKGETQPNGQPYVFTVPDGYSMIYEIWGLDEIWHIDEGLVPFGFVAQANGTSDLVITIRGTEGDVEWAEDLLEDYQTANPVPNSQGLIQYGFAAIYKTLFYVQATGNSTSPPPSSAARTLSQVLENAGSVTITGHSLGSSLADLTALDVALNESNSVTSFYTLASPRTGDPTFADSFDAKLQSVSYRVANVWDIVPQLPPEYFLTIDPPGEWHYQHVNSECLVDGGFSVDVAYSHSLVAYETGLQKLL